MSLNQNDEALVTVQKWVSVDKEHPQAQHLLAILGGDPEYKRASNGYIEDYFDGFAEGFENTLSQLKYETPKHIGELLEGLGLSPTTRARDLGCGTGLSGSVMQPYCEVLHGIDLSAGMLRIAKEKDIYQKLFKAELTDFLFTVIEPYNLIVSADTLCYFGDLEPVLKNAHRALTVPGDFVFSVEKGEADTPYKLLSSGRFAHSESYVRETLAQCGFQPPTVSSVKMRDDGTEPIFGYLFHTRRI
ncbi:MAG: methyltransferase domain-containing protein [Candidatus Eisenbacteria bacterium]|uniref:Methyltransferase domain-containing protein n=1 Tax=Eiseniibacteriota bacterium TaxID=2212470 RepID=A0A7Y2H2S3_UNCEI|nr:methyltransferase domain-containing protein [Candidatus Eisenbacteria bacterium]